ncbi:uncharacterized protein Z518_10659 [Rhinocladiella mackenziei CBS 650.93]|uniref:Rhinocladiella mackenziei CBS 650.93 unplaced genomic scaffold supercont1.9, whole genome shotgun sequence n=1 Tax=Rhinocladiella mackenziei CBS 650.93 TaxID=1442369 RepID=A0A0D2I449_9EURO|nr:uncharacterized protein Z518_10659 [Rhinocladiella mackenziei CBS 650.93]KIX00519.1 hypothetical protein Z518_10659 [Rhinocladiella mackenziei CBS 650.93]
MRDGQQNEESTLETPLVTPARPQPRIYYGVNIDELSSDSDLSDVPDDIGPDPFLPELLSPPSPSRVHAVTAPTQKRHRPTKSPYFPHKHRPTFLTTLPFPPISHNTFGLMQERLAHDPFRLLIATIFLNKTPGERAMPVFYQLMSKYPTPADLAHAEVADITSVIYGLGFQNQRARKCVAMAKVWIEKPPEKGKRYKKLNYPLKGDSKDIKDGETLGDDDNRVAWEISHLPGLGPYSHDSWRMFCRDALRGIAKSWNGEGAKDPETFEPEWKRVIPLDKELRAYLTWMWLKEGWVWNKETGQRSKASEELMTTAKGGGVVVEEKGSDHLLVKEVERESLNDLKHEKRIERTAGEYLPGNSPKDGDEPGPEDANETINDAVVLASGRL